MQHLALLATYPLLPQTKEWLRREGPKLEDLLSDFIYNRARDRARERVRQAMQNEDPVEPVLLSEIDAEMELLSHPMARLLVAAVDEPILLRRFAVHESKRLSHAVERDPGDVVVAVADALGIPHKRREEESGTVAYGLSLTEYLVRAPNEKMWHLVRRDPERGTVWLAKADFARVLEEVYRRRLEEELEGRAKHVPSTVHEVFRNEIGRLKQQAVELAARFKQADYSEVAPEVFPPCMKRILQDMHDHKNVPHMGRFAIVTFLHTLGMDSDEILKFFSSVPDFDPEKSRYQVEHITGKGGPTEYTPPGCGAMQSYGVCPLEERDTICAQIKHPLAYYRRALRRRDAAPQAPAPPGAADPPAAPAAQAKPAPPARPAVRGVRP